MTHESLINEDWKWTVDRLGGADRLAESARETKAFLRAREIGSALDLLRLLLAYCLGGGGLRSTAGWATATGLAMVSDVALLGRFRNMGAWLSELIAYVLEQGRPEAAKGRRIRILDATAVAQAGREAKRDNKLWRLHCSFELPSERFDYLVLTDEKGGERLDRIPVVAGEIRLGDAAYLQADQIGDVCEQGADVLVRASWRHARWLKSDGEQLDLLGLLKKARHYGVVDQPVWLGRNKGEPIALRLVALRKPEHTIAEARRKARRNAQREGRKVSQQSLLAAEWVILVTSLSADEFSTKQILKLYRMRWRIELAFKRLKSLIGLRSPPMKDPRLAKPWLLAHLLTILLVEPLMDEFGVALS
jgi:Transposase DDE domain